MLIDIQDYFNGICCLNPIKSYNLDVDEAPSVYSNVNAKLNPDLIKVLT